MAAPGSVLVLSVWILGLLHVETTADTLSSLDASFCHGGLEAIYPELDIDDCLIIPKVRKLREKVSTVWKAPQIYFSGAHRLAEPGSIAQAALREQRLDISLILSPSRVHSKMEKKCPCKREGYMPQCVKCKHGGSFSYYSLPVPAGPARFLQKKTYVLVMVDPDAPRRTNPSSAYWRHWLVVDIQGDALKKGQTQGTTLTDYYPPTPPHKSGFHRYQFMLFEKLPDAPVSLTKRETSSRGKWDLQAFITRFDLGEPVATLQFLTQNYKD